MLKNLLKYDLKNVYKVLIIFYILAIFFSILTRMFLSIDNSFIMNIIGRICSGVTISMIVSIIINNLMRAWVRFRSNFYGDESYLTHTLPVSKQTLYLSKVLMASISLLTSILIIIISLFIAYYSKENMNILKEVLQAIAEIYDSSLLSIITFFIIIIFLEFLNVLQTGYMGIILGHKMNSNKMPLSVLYGFIIYILIQVVVLLIMFIISVFNKDLFNLFITNEMISIATLKTIFLLAIIIYSLIFIVSYIINVRMFNKGVNVD